MSDGTDVIFTEAMLKRELNNVFHRGLVGMAKAQRKAKRQRGILVGPNVVGRIKFRDALRRVKAELKKVLARTTADGVTIEETSKVIGICATVDQLIKDLPTQRLKGNRVY